MVMELQLASHWTGENYNVMWSGLLE